MNTKADHSLGAVVTLRGVVYTVTDVSLHPADRSVGIMSAFVEGFMLQDAAGNEVPESFYDSMTDAEHEAVNEAVMNRIDEAAAEAYGSCGEYIES